MRKGEYDSVILLWCCTGTVVSIISKHYQKDESQVDDLNKKRGIVSGRVAFVATIHWD